MTTTSKACCLESGCSLMSLVSLACSLLPPAGEGGAERRMRVRFFATATPSPQPSPQAGEGVRESHAQQHAVRVLELVLDVDQEQHRVLAVDDAVVVGQRD